jgi:hypothetical protein
VTNVSVAPDQPAPGDLVTITTTVRNTGSSRRSYWVEAVALRAPPDASFEEYTRVEDVGSLTPGSTLRVPLRQRFGEPGTYRMRAVVYLENERDSRRRVQYPVVVEVTGRDERRPAVDVDVGRTVVGAETTVDVELANDLPTDVVGGSLSLSGGSLDVVDSRRVFARFERGAALNRSFAAVPTRAGRRTATLTVEYTTADGERRRFVEPVPLDVQAGEVRLDARVASPSTGDRDATDAAPNGTTSDRVVVATVTNGRAGPIRNVRLRDRSANVSLAGAIEGPIPEGASRTVRLPLGSVSGSGTVPLTATYEFDGRTGRTTGRVAVTDQPAEIALTGLVVDRRGDTVHVTGSASNVGLATAEGVLVSVVDTANVTPAAPHRDYFVGGVGVSNFVTFDVYARVDGDDVATVPLRVDYRSGGQQRSTVVEVPIEGPGAAGAAGAAGERAEAPDPRQVGGGNGGSRGGDGGGGPLPVPLSLVGAVVGLVALLVVGVVAYRWRRNDDRP